MPASRRNGSGDPARIDVTLWGISDGELLAVVDDLADENGWTHTTDVRLQLGEKLEADQRTRSGVGPRLSPLCALSTWPTIASPARRDWSRAA